MTKPAKKRPPLKDPAMRNPGQSLAEARRRVWEDFGFMPALATACFAMVALIKWIEQASGNMVPAWVWTILMLLSLIWLVYRMIKAQPVIRALAQGEQGERAVGQFLERLREDGYQVFHDLIGDGFNLDHVIIGPAGVFTIETKTWSKPATGQ
ncbi:MAG: nuclease-related domain-containing protein, partial [Wenzhouxiangella sp.]|nr:nuclease-related domain-containing protein [Wenzhouxiangella sp.]